MKNRKVFLLFPLFVSLMASCHRDEEIFFASKYEDIRFSVCDSILASGSIETKAMENEITCDITDWEYVEDSTATKASLTQTLTGTVGVFGYTFKNTWSGTEKPTVMYNLKSTVADGSLTPEEKKLWKNYSDSLRFYAYAPYGKFTLSGENVGGVPYLTYTVPTTNKEQIDVLYAQSANIAPSNRDAVPLQFKHAMTAVQFRLGIDGATLTNVTVSGVRSSGQLALDGTWSNQSGTASYSVEKIDSLLILVPQTVPAGAKITLSYNDGTNNNTIEASIAGQVWPAGKKVYYILKKKKADDKDEFIYFDLGLGDICLTAREGATYSGYINVAGTKTEVTGIHKNSNKYYIYQSINYGEYSSDHNVDDVRAANTGYATQADWEAKQKCRVPQYKSDIMYYSQKGGKWADWGAYITNNPDPHTVITDWNNGDQNYSTKNKIQICGHETNPTCFDITLDRVYSRFFPYCVENADGTQQKSDNGQDKQGAITIGDDQPGLNHEFRNYGTEQVTLRLKNNNVLGRIHYKKPVANEDDGKSWLKITSADGDGISSGTLTVITRNSISDASFDNSLCALIGSATLNGTPLPDGQGYVNRQVCDLFFNGGIVYVGTRSFLSSTFENNHYLLSCIGAPNSESHITIDGATLTSVSNTTAPAIGGGGGWEDMGGKGVVNIMSGNVYAYAFGVRGQYNGSWYTVANTALGGGSTLGTQNSNSVGGPGVVNITGGNVYAYSVGGIALGGGASGLHAGGTSGINISGGTVTAISASGNIAGSYKILAGTAIGGGRAGAIDGNGGTAEVLISGGIIHSGSVGGGKCDNSSGKLGRAIVTVSGGETSAQFLLVKDPSEATFNTFNMTDGTIKSSNTSDTSFPKVNPNGGAVYMESGTCNISGGTISKCYGTLGGAVYMNGGTFTMSGTGKISDCTSANDGGAVYIEGGSATVSGGEIYHNIASKGNGGGVCIKGGNFTMTGGKINNNTSDSNKEASSYYGGNGGGIYVSSTDTDPEVKLLGGEITYNAADRDGGGLCVDMSETTEHKATITIGKVDTVQRDTLSPNIRLNSAALSGGGMDVQGSGSKITIYSGTVKGNVSAFVKNEDIRNDGGLVELVGKNDPGKKPQVNVLYNTIKFYANNGNDPEPYDEQRVITSTNSILQPTATALAFEKEFFHIASWNTRRDGTGTSYKTDGGGAVMNITADVSLYAQWVANQ